MPKRTATKHHGMYVPARLLNPGVAVRVKKINTRGKIKTVVLEVSVRQIDGKIYPTQECELSQGRHLTVYLPIDLSETGR
jgi:hypothetical protein